MPKDCHVLIVEEPETSSAQNTSTDSTKKWEEIEKQEFQTTRYRSISKTLFSEFTNLRVIESGKKGNIHFIHPMRVAKKKINGVEVTHFIKTIIERDSSEEEKLAANPPKLKDSEAKAISNKLTFKQLELEAKIEVMGLRYSRLGDLAQPPAYYSFDEEKQQHLVISVGVDGCKVFADIPYKVIHDNIVKGRYKSAGLKLFERLVMCDLDANTSNLVKDKNNNIINLDGGWYFGSRFRDFQSSITEYDVKHFPMIKDYSPDSFLDHIVTYKTKRNGKKKRQKIVGKGEILSDAMIHNEQFQREYFEGIMRSLVLPDEFNLRFAKAWITDYAHMVTCNQIINIDESYSNLIKRPDEYYQTLRKEKLAKIKQQMIGQSMQDIQIAYQQAKERIDREIESMRDPNFMEEADKIGKIIITRKNQFRDVVVEWMEFRNYLRNHAPQAFEQYINTMKQYAALDDDPVFDYVPHLEESMRARLRTLQLCRQYKQIICTKLVSLGDRHQRNTRISLDGTHITIAKTDGLTLFSQLPAEIIQRNILSGAYRGFGTKLFWNWALDNDEFLPENIGVDNAGRVQLLEAGIYLGHMTRNYLNKMTVLDFEHFPFLRDFKSLQFLDLFDLLNGKNPGGHILTEKMICNAQFRREFFAGALQFMLIPDAFISLATFHVIKATSLEMQTHLGYEIDEEQDKRKAIATIKEILERRAQTKRVAMQTPLFVKYLQHEAKEDLAAYLAEIREFNAQDEYLSAVPNFEALVIAEFQSLTKPEKTLSRPTLPMVKEESDDEQKPAAENNVDMAQQEEENVPAAQEATQQDNTPQENVELKENQFTPLPLSATPQRKSHLSPKEHTAVETDWFSVVLGVAMALAVANVVLTGAALFLGVSIVAILSTHLALSIGLGTAAALIGGAVGYFFSRPESEMEQGEVLSVTAADLNDVLDQDDTKIITNERLLQISPDNGMEEDTPEKVQSPIAKPASKENKAINKMPATPVRFNRVLAPMYARQEPPKEDSNNFSSGLNNMLGDFATAVTSLSDVESKRNKVSNENSQHDVNGRSQPLENNVHPVLSPGRTRVF